jgi:hypothetical protein
MWDELGQWLEDNLQIWADQWLDHWDQIAREIATELRDLVENLIEPDPIPDIRTTAHPDNDTINDTRVEYWPSFADEDEDPFNASGFTVEEFRVSPFGMGLIVTYRSTGLTHGIGDPSCLYNARSPQLRCAVNPAGPCEGCKHYQQQ